MATSAATRVKGVDAVWYPVKDLDRATKFYNDLLGMAPTKSWPNFGVEYTLPNGESFGFAKIPESTPFSAAWRSGSGVMFAVDDLDAAVEAAKARGVKFFNDGKVSETPVCYMVFGEDGEGNTFILHKRK